MLAAGFGDLGRAVAFCKHDHRTAFVHKSIDVRIHSLSGGGAERAGRFSDRGFGGTCVVDGVIFKVVWHGFAVL